MGKRKCGTKKKKLKMQKMSTFVKCEDKKRRTRMNHSILVARHTKRAKRAQKKHGETTYDATRDAPTKSARKAAKLLAAGVGSEGGEQNFGTFCAQAEAVLKRKQTEHTRADRCDGCWHHRTRCVCAKISALSAALPAGAVAPPLISGSRDIRVVVYMHYLEWGNAANTGKLLRLLAPRHAKLRVYGRLASDDALRATIAADPSRCMLLYPGEIEGRRPAVSSAEFLETNAIAERGGPEAAAASAAREVDISDAAVDKAVAEETMRRRQRRTARLDAGLTIIVLDGTFAKARTMAKHFARRIDPTGKVRQVKLSSAEEGGSSAPSVFSRAQHGYGTSAGATVGGRVSTVEAVARLLAECGAPSGRVSKLVRCVKVNDAALRPVKGAKRDGVDGADGDHGVPLTEGTWSGDVRDLD